MHANNQVHPGGPPQGGYGPPPPGYGGPPQPGYGGPQPGYGPPPGQGGPPPGMGGPQPGYGPPPGQGGPPPPGYGGPQPGYGPPPGQGGPPPGMGGPQPGYGQPPGQGGPPPGMGGPQPGYGPPPGQGPPPGMGGPPPGMVMPPQPTDGWQRPAPQFDEGDSGGSDDEGPSSGPNMPPMQLEGYGNIQGVGQGSMLMPPPPPPPPNPDDAPHNEFKDVANLNEQQCREAVLEMVAQNCCYGKGCAEDHVTTEIKPSTALHYVLETYSEGRTTSREYEPHPGGPVDGPENGRAPLPWEIPCEPSQLFEDELREIEVPHTSYVKTCHRCDGCGQVRCCRCGGRGRVRCTSCGGDGRKQVYVGEGDYEQRPCGMCGGDGRRCCHRCGGDGRIRCDVCCGHGRLRYFIELSVAYTNHTKDFIMEETDMPDEFVRDVEGINIFSQTLPQLWPIAHYPVQVINQNSIRLVEGERVAYPNERQLQQRHTLYAVPVTEVHFTWKDMADRYWVCGTDRQVHFPSYPQTCCWGCQIL